MNNVIEVEIKISQLVQDLRDGLTWFQSEDKGQGSIQYLYEMEDQDIIDIQSHPAFQVPIRRFKIIDDYKKTPVATSDKKEEVKVQPMRPSVENNTEELVAEEQGSLEFFSL